MNSQRAPKLITVVILVVTGAVTLGWTAGQGFLVHAQAATHAPQPVRLTPTERETIRRAMRTMLRSLDGILHGLAEGNTEMVEQAGRAAGKAIALDPELDKKVPRPYAQLDRRMHQGFDQLAAASKGKSMRGDVIAGLARIGGYCVACHEMFRVEEVPPRPSGE